MRRKRIALSVALATTLFAIGSAHAATVQDLKKVVTSLPERSGALLRKWNSGGVAHYSKGNEDTSEWCNILIFAFERHDNSFLRDLRKTEREFYESEFGAIQTEKAFSLAEMPDMRGRFRESTKDEIMHLSWNLMSERLALNVDADCSQVSDRPVVVQFVETQIYKQIAFVDAHETGAK